MFLVMIVVKDHIGDVNKQIIEYQSEIGIFRLIRLILGSVITMIVLAGVREMIVAIDIAVSLTFSVEVNVHFRS